MVCDHWWVITKKVGCGAQSAGLQPLTRKIACFSAFHRSATNLYMGAIRYMLIILSFDFLCFVLNFEHTNKNNVTEVTW